MDTTFGYHLSKSFTHPHEKNKKSGRAHVAVYTSLLDPEAIKDELLSRRSNTKSIPVIVRVALGVDENNIPYVVTYIEYGKGVEVSGPLFFSLCGGHKPYLSKISRHNRCKELFDGMINLLYNVEYFQDGQFGGKPFVQINPRI